MATISTVNGKKITKIKYKGEIFDTGGGVNPLQHIIDNHKGDNQPSGEDLFYEYWGSSLDDAINSCDFSKITSAKKMFYDCKNLTSVPYFNTSNCTDMSYMFDNCSKLTIVPQLDTSNVTNMSCMFRSCSKLTIVPQLDTSNVTNMEQMVQYCSYLKKLDFTHMNLTSPSATSYFAYGCYSLIKLIIRNMDTIPVLDSTAFLECYHFKGIKNSNFNPQGLKDGRIYVPDDKVEELKTATNWSVYADIIVPLSTLVE